MTVFSVLDLVPVREGGSVAEAMGDAAEAARAAEAAGYKRFWVAEHHGMDGIAGGATAVVLAHLGHVRLGVEPGDLLLEDLRDFGGTDIHGQAAPFIAYCRRCSLDLMLLS